MFKRLYPILPYNVKRVLLLLAAGAFFLWFGGKAIFELWGYSCLQKHTRAVPLEWKIEERGAKSFITLRYSFELEGRKYEGKTLFKEPVFLNPLSAEMEMKKWENYSWAAWYDPAKPERSSLQKLFPYKTCINAFIVLGVLVYFLFLIRMKKEREEARIR